jgi:hypothetical protein
MLNSDGFEIDTGLDVLMAQVETQPIAQSPASGSQETDETSDKSIDVPHSHQADNRHIMLNSDGLEIDAGIDELMARYNVVYK